MNSPLLLANVRYWPTVAPVLKRELARWRAHAAAIPTPELRALALAKLRDEHFNARVAATLATLAPLRHRAETTAAIVAYQVAYDYLDGLTEQPVDEHLQSNLQLYTALTDAVAPSATAGADYYRHRPRSDDGGYLQALSRTVADCLARLPAATAIRPAVRKAAGRFAESQARVHATGSGDPASLAAWAKEQAVSTPLQWREWLAGAVSSVLSVHALIAAAADHTTTPQLADALDDAYLPIAALSTMLDSLVDWHGDHATGQTPWLLSHYEHPADLTEPLSRTASCASAQAAKLPHAAHHIMTMTGVVAYYTCRPAATEPHARPAVEHLHRELPATLAPTLAVMRVWRSAQHASHP